MAHDPLRSHVRDYLGTADLARDVADAVRHLNDIRRRLARIERTVNVEGAIMSEVDDRLTQVQTEVAGLADDVQRELADLAAALSGTLSADQRSKFDALDEKLASIKDAVDQADPQQPAPAPAPEPTV